MRKGSQRVAKCEKIKKVETRSGGNSAGRTNLKNLSEDLLPNNQGRRQRVSPRGREVNAATARRKSRHKIGESKARKGKERIRSVNRGELWINRSSPSKNLPLESHSPQTFQVSKVSVRVPQRSRHSRIVERSKMMPNGAMRSAGKSVGALNRTNRPQVLLLARRLQLRLHLLSRRVSKASGTKAIESSDPSLVRRASAIRKVRMSSKSRLKRHVKTPSRPERARKTSVRSKRVDHPQSAANRTFNSSSSGSAATKKLKVRSLAPRKGSSKNPRATARRAREKRVTPRAKAKATHRAAKDRARRGEASRPRLPTVVPLDFVAETTIFSGYEKIVPRFRLRGVRLGFGVCRRLLLGQEVQGGRQDRGLNQAELGALNSIDHLHKRSAG